MSAAWADYYVRRSSTTAPISRNPDYQARAFERLSVRGQAAPSALSGMLAVQHDLSAVYGWMLSADADWERQHCIYGNQSSGARSHWWRVTFVHGCLRSKLLPSSKTGESSSTRRAIASSATRSATSSTTSGVGNGITHASDLVGGSSPGDLHTATRGSGAAEHVPEGFWTRWHRLQAAGIA